MVLVATETKYISACLALVLSMAGCGLTPNFWEGTSGIALSELAKVSNESFIAINRVEFNKAGSNKNIYLKPGRYNITYVVPPQKVGTVTSSRIIDAQRGIYEVTTVYGLKEKTGKANIKEERSCHLTFIAGKYYESLDVRFMIWEECNELDQALDKDQY